MTTLENAKALIKYLKNLREQPTVDTNAYLKTDQQLYPPLDEILRKISSGFDKLKFYKR